MINVSLHMYIYVYRINIRKFIYANNFLVATLTPSKISANPFSNVASTSNDSTFIVQHIQISFKFIVLSSNGRFRWYPSE